VGSCSTVGDDIVPADCSQHPVDDLSMGSSTDWMQILQELLEDIGTPEGVEDQDLSTSTTKNEVVGSTTAQLESIKELVRFDHGYSSEPGTVSLLPIDITEDGVSNTDISVDDTMIQEPIADVATTQLDEMMDSNLDIPVIEITDDVYDACKECAKPDTVCSEHLVEVSDSFDQQMEDATAVVMEDNKLESSDYDVDAGVSCLSPSSSVSLSSPYSSSSASSVEGRYLDVGSDCGYESSTSIHSPYLSDTDRYDALFDNSAWEDSFRELFPTLA